MTSCRNTAVTSLLLPKEKPALYNTSMSSKNPTEDEQFQDVGNPQQRMASASEVAASTSTSTSTSASTWKLEESSIWWLSYFWEPGKPLGWISNPGNILLLTSVPFFAGAYFGYRMPTEQLEDLIQGGIGSTDSSDGIDNSSQKKSRINTSSGNRISASIKAVDQDLIRVAAAQTASKALRIATLGIVGAFGFVGAMGFYMSGHNSMENAVAGTTTWASSWGKSMEHVMGGDQAVSKTHPDVLATKHMKGEEEWRYVYDKYIKEEGDEDKDTLWQDDNEPQKDKDALPTLYSIYEKYFKKKDNE